MASMVPGGSGGVTDTNVDTITTFIMRECSGDRELAVFMNAMQLSFKFIVRAVRKAGIADLYGLANTQNSSGDDVKKLDLLSDDIMIDALINKGDKEAAPCFLFSDPRRKFSLRCACMPCMACMPCVVPT